MDDKTVYAMMTVTATEFQDDGVVEDYALWVWDPNNVEHGIAEFPINDILCAYAEDDPTELLSWLVEDALMAERYGDFETYWGAICPELPEYEAQQMWDALERHLQRFYNAGINPEDV